MNEAFVRHLERASEIVSTWPEWKQNLLGRRTMNQVDQAARRAAEQIDHRKWDKEMNMAETKQIIAAEFAPLQERLVEAERLLGLARKPVADWSSLPEERNPTLADIDKFLAAKENGNG